MFFKAIGAKKTKKITLSFHREKAETSATLKVATRIIKDNETVDRKDFQKLAV